jgi:mitogen-activated protein kinase kinase kinase
MSAGTPRPILSTQSPLLGYTKDQITKPERAMQSVNFGASSCGRSSPGGSPRSPGFTWGKGNTLFKIPNYEEGALKSIQQKTKSIVTDANKSLV